LQGASHTTGASTRGRAAGNVFNFADAADFDMDMSVLRIGKIHLHNSQVESLDAKPSRILKVDVQFSMAPVLKSIAEKWSPIESMAFGATDLIVYNNLYDRFQSPDLCL